MSDRNMFLVGLILFGLAVCIAFVIGGRWLGLTLMLAMAGTLLVVGMVYRSLGIRVADLQVRLAECEARLVQQSGHSHLQAANPHASSVGHEELAVLRKELDELKTRFRGHDHGPDIESMRF